MQSCFSGCIETDYFCNPFAQLRHTVCYAVRMALQPMPLSRKPAPFEHLEAVWIPLTVIQNGRLTNLPRTITCAESVPQISVLCTLAAKVFAVLMDCHPNGNLFWLHRGEHRSGYGDPHGESTGRPSAKTHHSLSGDGQADERSGRRSFGLG